MLSHPPLCLLKTERFSVLGKPGEGDAAAALPVMKLTDLLLHRRRKMTEQVRRKLWKCLQTKGFVILTLSKECEPARVVDDLRQSLYRDFFPSLNGTATSLSSTPCSSVHRQRNVNNLKNGSVYQSEKGVPMWRLGYELCDDIREVRPCVFVKVVLLRGHADKCCNIIIL